MDRYGRLGGRWGPLGTAIHRQNDGIVGTNTALYGVKHMALGGGLVVLWCTLLLHAD
jgi:hypothetical protein